ncbi:MAG TPA: hypothetical protein ENI41_05785 [Deltaproteobacteria bacterium]|nr:MAG: hypothetical protein DRG83_12220 [Deltaproteobacteria bacterium]HEC31981.1 hypothetical protein [Deltaproteobacteria bacterium]
MGTINLSYKGEERRQEPRREVDLAVLIARENELYRFSSWVEGRVVDASPKGVRVCAPRLPEVNETIEMFCMLTTTNTLLPTNNNVQFYRMRGRIVWKDSKNSQMGVVFI